MATARTIRTMSSTGTSFPIPVAGGLATGGEETAGMGGGAGAYIPGG